MCPNSNATASATETGWLIIKVESAIAPTPIRNAWVRIFGRGSKTILSEQMTNSSGKTTNIALPAPPLAFSQSPVLGKPYKEYTIQVDATGYDSVTVEGVQIFPGTTALQTIHMRKISANNSNTPSLIIIPPHTLWGNYPPKIMEAEVKPLPDSQDVSLSEFFIPKLVTVHLGTPTDSSVQNIAVTFKDYIKNVASCEIYPTWSAETVRTIIYSIISCLLNRYYTKWYPEKGYDYTTTNSTAYDQSFAPDRNIYKEISHLVDEVFSTYITKPAINQPLFALYCDGAKGPCRGLDKWGANDLSKENYSAVDILKNYYGENIYLLSAKHAETVPIPFPGITLEIGVTDNTVRTIQERLNSIAAHYPEIPLQSVDGIYSESTAQAVSILQNIFDLPVTGKVDLATWEIICNTCLALSSIAEPTFYNQNRRRRFRY